MREEIPANCGLVTQTHLGISRVGYALFHN